jgi:fumarate hydratase subunit alpha
LAVIEIDAKRIKEEVKRLALKANIDLPADVAEALDRAYDTERIPIAKEAFGDIIENAKRALRKERPICQDCGLAVVFLEVGQDVHITGGGLEEAVHEGVREAYTEGSLRKSVVLDPLFDRKNSGDNTPAVIHTKIVPGSEINISISPKGMGSENMSKIYMLRPADGREGVVNAAVETVKSAGANPCPPIVLGIGIGGNFETVALAAKKALLRDGGARNPNPDYAELELEILEKVNGLGIGPGGYGGITTALDVRIETLPTHIAGMPVAINLCCHALRHASGRVKGA